MLRALTRRLLKLLLWLMLASALLVLVLRWVPPPGTALMIERKIESWGSGQSLELKRQWRPWNELPDHLKMAVIAAEDQKFAEHWGFDVGAIQAALAHRVAARYVAPVPSASRWRRTCSSGLAVAGCARDWKPGSPR